MSKKKKRPTIPFGAWIIWCPKNGWLFESLSRLKKNAGDFRAKNCCDEIVKVLVLPKIE